jgi:hypothetical protein
MGSDAPRAVMEYARRQLIEPRPAICRFATSVVGAALARGDGAQDITARLYESLANLVGSAGFDVLLARSLVLARRVHPFLAAVTVGPGGTLSGLGEASDPPSVEQGTVAIVSYFIELLAVLIGEDLTIHLVRDVWPEAWAAGSAPSENENE